MIECCSRKPEAPSAKTPAPLPEGILNLIVSSQQFLEGGEFVTLCLVPEIISAQKRTIDRAHDDDSLPEAARLASATVEMTFTTASAASCLTTTRPSSKQRSSPKWCYWQQSWTLAPRCSIFHQRKARNALKQFSSAA